MTETALGNALAFAKRNHPVLPLHFPIREDSRLTCSCRRKRGDGCISPAKHPYAPLVPRGLLDATADLDRVRRWFDSDLNLGVRTSNGDALLVLDIDPRHDGDKSLAALEQKHGAFPHTWRSITGSGGEHVFFDASGLGELKHGRDKDIGLGSGIDVPHYVVGPGSRHICGRLYAWSVDHHPAETPLARPPAWLVEHLQTGRIATDGGTTTAHDPVAWAAAHGGMVTEYRDVAICEVAGKLLRAVSIDPAFALTLVHAWNETHCAPPLAPGEVVQIFDRLARRQAAREREWSRVDA
jgi:putative DNA primase/helicase